MGFFGFEGSLERKITRDADEDLNFQYLGGSTYGRSWRVNFLKTRGVLWLVGWLRWQLDGGSCNYHRVFSGQCKKKAPCYTRKEGTFRVWSVTSLFSVDFQCVCVCFLQPESTIEKAVSRSCGRFLSPVKLVKFGSRCPIFGGYTP